MKNLCLLTLTLFAANVQAETYSEVSTVKGITIGTTTAARVVLDSMKPGVESQCSDQKYYSLDLSNKEMFSGILAAKASGAKLSFQLNGCENNRPKIVHVYLCDQKFCGY